MTANKLKFGENTSDMDISERKHWFKQTKSRTVELFHQDAAQGIAYSREMTESGKMSVNEVATILYENGLVQELTKYCITYLKDETEEDGEWQTKVLELCLLDQPYLAELAFQKTSWTKFDRSKIGKLFHSKGFHQASLMCYNDPHSIMSVIRNIHAISEEFLIEYFGRLPNHTVLDTFDLLLKHSKQNKSTVINIAVANMKKLGVIPVVHVFDKLDDDEGVQQYLSDIIDKCTDKQVFTKYIESCMAVGQYDEVTYVLKKYPEHCDPLRTKKILFSKKWKDLEDYELFHKYVDNIGYLELFISYLCKHNLLNELDNYATEVNPEAGHLIIAAMIDNKINDEPLLKSIIKKMYTKCDTIMLQIELAKRHRTELLKGCLV